MKAFWSVSTPLERGMEVREMGTGALTTKFIYLKIACSSAILFHLASTTTIYLPAAILSTL